MAVNILHMKSLNAIMQNRYFSLRLKLLKSKENDKNKFDIFHHNLIFLVM